MKRYKDWSPSTHDVKGLNLPEKQDWFVLGIMRTRDSCPLDESNFASALARLGGESDTCMVAPFNHWACGWFEIILIAPEREADGQAIMDRLDGYPVLDEDDFRERESEFEFECWPNYGAEEMIAKMTIKFDLRKPTVEFLQSLDLSSNGALRELHTQYSSHEYEMDDQGARYDFLYLDTRYLHFPENQRFSRQVLANFICAERAKLRAAKQDAREHESSMEAIDRLQSNYERRLP